MTEDLTQTVTVSHAEVRIEHEPITEADVTWRREVATHPEDNEVVE